MEFLQTGFLPHLTMRLLPTAFLMWGELPAKYAGWEIVHHEEGTFTDSHPGDIHHEHAYERIIARKVQK